MELPFEVKYVDVLLDMALRNKAKIQLRFPSAEQRWQCVKFLRDRPECINLELRMSGLTMLEILPKKACISIA